MAKQKAQVPTVVLEQLEMVRMQGRFNMIEKTNVQVAAHDLDCHELVCFIEDLPRRGGWMAVLNALGDFTNAMTNAEREALRDRLDDYEEED